MLGLENLGVGPEKRVTPKEGELYKVLTVYGKEFPLYYGYYEEKDRYSKYNDPVEIYPNFIVCPVYTDDGIPFATAMQDPCKHFKGAKSEDSTCFHCSYYKKCEELLGICTCTARRQQA